MENSGKGDKGITECQKFESYTENFYSFLNFNIHPDTNAFDWYELKKACCLYECEIHHLAAGIELKRFTLQPSNLIQRMVYKCMYISKRINSVA